jgi:cytoskeletal protein RodZ
MPAWAWVLIGIGVVVVIALIVWQLISQQRTRRLRGQFGPEYQRTVSEADSRRAAEAELSEREKRRQELDIRPLSADERARYSDEWQTVQAQFVDDPAGAVVRADSLIQSVMSERGYPMEDFEQRAADVSVDHPRVVENYREGHRLFEKTAAGQGSTEDLRQAMRAYRKLFEELVEDTGAETAEPEPRADDRTREEAGRR